MMSSYPLAPALQATKLDFVKIAESYPVKLQMLAITAKRDNDYIFDSWLYNECERINYWSLSSDKEIRNEKEQNMLNYIETFKSRNILGSFLAAVMVQVYGRSFTPEFKIKLFNVTKEIVDQVPSLLIMTGRASLFFSEGTWSTISFVTLNNFILNSGVNERP